MKLEFGQIYKINETPIRSSIYPKNNCDADNFPKCDIEQKDFFILLGVNELKYQNLHNFVIYKILYKNIVGYIWYCIDKISKENLIEKIHQ